MKTPRTPDPRISPRKVLDYMRVNEASTLLYFLNTQLLLAEALREHLRLRPWWYRVMQFRGMVWVITEANAFQAACCYRWLGREVLTELYGRQMRDAHKTMLHMGYALRRLRRIYDGLVTLESGQTRALLQERVANLAMSAGFKSAYFETGLEARTRYVRHGGGLSAEQLKEVDSVFHFIRSEKQEDQYRPLQ